ncbi:hypothetical protein CRG98_048639, partial [Punica granatum]
MALYEVVKVLLMVPFLVGAACMITLMKRSSSSVGATSCQRWRSLFPPWLK